jgi:hypothetical protein
MLWKSAIQKTLHELKLAAVYELQLRIPSEDTNTFDELLEETYRKI